MKSKNFNGREGLVVTDEMRILISATAVQLTFGLRNYLIFNLNSINIFPHVFYSKFFQKSFKGLTTQAGILSLSWNDFREGFMNEHDRLNLGLHELAHALHIDIDKEGNYDSHFRIHFQKWKEIACKDFLKLKENEIGFFRNYGTTNIHEFFAVCIEHFFESPIEFKAKLPDLYRYTTLLLNQDPGNSEEDYRIKKFNANQISMDNSLVISESDDKTVFMEENKLQKFIRSKGIYAAMITTTIGLFIGIPLLFWLVSVTVISIGLIIILIFGCGILGLIQWKFVKEYIDMEYHQFTMYAFSGFGMCLINFILFLNYIVPVNTYIETYNISRIGISHNGYDVILEKEGNNNALERNLGVYFNDHFTSAPASKKITVTFDTGLFGFDNIQDCKID